MTVEILQQHRVAGGTLHYCRHSSQATGTPMKFSLFLPPGNGLHPLLLWLSGLTCTEENFTTKAGAYLRSGTPRPCDPCARHEPAWRRRGGRSSLRPGPGRRFLRRCDAGSLVAALPDGILGHCRAAGRRGRPLRRGLHALRHQRPLHGRPRRADDGAAPPAQLPQCLCLRPDLLADALPLGRKGVRRLPGPRPCSLGGTRRLAADRGRGGARPLRQPARGPGRTGHLPRRAS